MSDLPEVIIKTTAAVESVEDADHPNGGFEVVISDDTEDRDGEIVDKGAFLPLPEHISADVDHGMSVVTTVGSGVPYTDEQGRTVVKGTFASTDLGQATRTLVREGHIRTASVAFLRKTATKAVDGKRHVTKAELLNFAFTPVPANRNAVVLSAKSAAAVAALKEGRRNSTDDAARLQDAHDTLVVLGATCDDGTTSSSKSLRRPASVKSIVGSVEALQDRVSDALEDAYAAEYGYWGWLRGVLPNDARDGGTVIFQSSRVTDGYESATYSQAYTDDGAVVALLGEAVEVDIHEIVAPDADADRESAKSAARPAAPPGPAAQAADDDALALEIRARGLALRSAALSG